MTELLPILNPDSPSPDKHSAPAKTDGWAYLELLLNDLVDTAEHCGRIFETHRQILCHVSWHLKQM